MQITGLPTHAAATARAAELRRDGYLIQRIHNLFEHDVVGGWAIEARRPSAIAKQYKSLCVEDDEGDELLDTVLDEGRVTATILDHGLNPNVFWHEHTSPIVTLRDLRDHLGY